MLLICAIVDLLFGLHPDDKSNSNLSAPFDGCASQVRRCNFTGARAFYGAKMKEVSLTNSPLKFTVDDSDFEMVNKFKWQLNPDGYVYRFTKNNETIRVHRFILGVPENLLVDHRDLNTLNNQRYNLRPATKAQNSQNRPKVSTPTSSKYKGVYKNKYGRWAAQITTNPRGATYLGQFKTEEEAAGIYDAQAKKHFGEFARLNFPK